VGEQGVREGTMTERPDYLVPVGDAGCVHSLRKVRRDYRPDQDFRFPIPDSRPYISGACTDTILAISEPECSAVRVGWELPSPCCCA
jgi:hypothetical protein